MAINPYNISVYSNFNLSNLTSLNINSSVTASIESYSSNAAAGQFLEHSGLTYDQNIPLKTPQDFIDDVAKEVDDNINNLGRGIGKSSIGKSIHRLYELSFQCFKNTFNNRFINYIGRVISQLQSKKYDKPKPANLEYVTCIQNRSKEIGIRTREPYASAIQCFEKSMESITWMFNQENAKLLEHQAAKIAQGECITSLPDHSKEYRDIIKLLAEDADGLNQLRTRNDPSFLKKVKASRCGEETLNVFKTEKEYRESLGDLSDKVHNLLEICQDNIQKSKPVRNEAKKNKINNRKNNRAQKPHRHR